MFAGFGREVWVIRIHTSHTPDVSGKKTAPRLPYPPHNFLTAWARRTPSSSRHLLVGERMEAALCKGPPRHASPLRPREDLAMTVLQMSFHTLS